MNQTKIITKSASATIAFTIDETKCHLLVSGDTRLDPMSKNQKNSTKEKEFDVASHSAFKTPPYASKRKDSLQETLTTTNRSYDLIVNTSNISSKEFKKLSTPLCNPLPHPPPIFWIFQHNYYSSFFYFWKLLFDSLETFFAKLLKIQKPSHRSYDEL